MVDMSRPAAAVICNGRRVQTMRDEAWRAAEAVDERYFTSDALERQVKVFARYILDLADLLDLTDRVAHAAWHLMDDSGELDTTDSNGRPDYMHDNLDHQRVSDALDALEAVGWDAHPDA